METVNDAGSGGVNPSKPSPGKGTAVQQPAASQTANRSVATTVNRTQPKTDIAPVNADDAFLSGFNADYRSEYAAPSTETTNTFVQRNNRKKPGLSAEQTLSQKGITPLHDGFLDGFYADDRTPWYTGKWEPVQPDTAGSGLQIHARQKQPKPHTDAALQTAYEEAKRYYESIRDELEQTANENRMDTPWYDVLSSEYGPALEQYRELEEQYTARQKELEVSKQLAEDFARSHKYTLPTGNREYDREKARLKKAADEEQARLMDPRYQYFQMTSLPDTPAASYIYYLRQLEQSPMQVAYEQYIADETKAENQAAQEKIRKWAEEHGVAASAVSLLTSPLKGVDYFNGVMETAVSGHKRPSSVPSFTETTNVIRDEVGENLAENYGEGARFVYNTVMSGADTVIAGLTGNVSGSIILGAGTASDTANDILNRGGTEEDALIGGAVSGILEGVFEKISLGQLEAMKALPADTVKNILGNIAKSVATNAGEEFSTELANTIFDTIFMGELSTYALTVQGYMSQGKSEADARWLANQDILKRLGESALSGALMGVLFGTGASANAYYNSQLAAQGDAKLLSGEMPTPKQLEAMGLSEAEARGTMVVLNLDQYDDSTDSHVETGTDLGLEIEPDTKKPYATSRPSYAKGQVEAVWELALKEGNGVVKDPSGAIITWDRSKPRKGQWDMGHRPDAKYSEVHKRYMAGEMSKEDFLAWYRDPTNYRPELPSTNRSHKYE